MNIIEKYNRQFEYAGILMTVLIAFGFTYYCLLIIIEAFSMRPRFGAMFIKHPIK